MRMRKASRLAVADCRSPIANRLRLRGREACEPQRMRELAIEDPDQTDLCAQGQGQPKGIAIFIRHNNGVVKQQRYTVQSGSQQ